MIYIYYSDSATVDYLFLLALYSIAKSNNVSKLKDTINYKSLRELSELLKQANYNISTATLNRILNNRIQEYKEYFSYNKGNKTITLNIDFRNNKSQSKRPFITLNAEEVKFLISQSDNLLCKYYFYIKYYCGKSKCKSSDFTAKQCLDTIGYSIHNNKYISKLSQYNNLLVDRKLIKIEKYRDSNGHERNRYII